MPFPTLPGSLFIEFVLSLFRGELFSELVGEPGPAGNDVVESMLV